jgi:tetratricopeptide (TPR) repeat protein
MSYPIILSPKQYFLYAGDTFETWTALEGQGVTHHLYGNGTVLEVESEYVLISFGKPEQGGAYKSFRKEDFRDGKYFTELSVPEKLPKNVLLAIQRAEEEKEAREDFSRLKRKYHVEWYQDSNPISQLYKILLQLNDGKSLDFGEIQWLTSKNLFAVLAYNHEVNYKRFSDGWELVHASSNWRKAKLPLKAIELTENFTSGDNKILGAILTSRGGAFRDINELEKAENFAREAINVNPTSYYPYNLLGAIRYQSGDPVTGDKYFAKAIELGSSQKQQDEGIKSAIEGAVNIVRKTVAEYLLKKDPERYKWAKNYL